MPKWLRMIYTILCCRCTSCVLFEEIESGILDTPEKFSKRKKELNDRF